MEVPSFFESGFFIWVVIPLLIFFARIIDVSIGTMRIVYIARGFKFLAPIFGFVEILVWLLAIGQIMRNLTNPLYYVAYAAGFATGNLVGMYIEEWLAVGRVIIRIITQRDSSKLVQFLRSSGYGVTTVDAEGATGNVKLIFTVVDRESVESIIPVIHKYNPRAFYSVEDVRLAREGIFPPSRRLTDLLRLRRKE